MTPNAGYETTAVKRHPARPKLEKQQPLRTPCRTRADFRRPGPFPIPSQRAKFSRIRRRSENFAENALPTRTRVANISAACRNRRSIFLSRKPSCRPGDFWWPAFRQSSSAKILGRALSEFTPYRTCARYSRVSTSHIQIPGGPEYMRSGPANFGLLRAKWPGRPAAKKQRTDPPLPPGNRIIISTALKYLRRSRPRRAGASSAKLPGFRVTRLNSARDGEGEFPRRAYITVFRSAVFLRGHVQISACCTYLLQTNQRDGCAFSVKLPRVRRILVNPAPRLGGRQDSREIQTNLGASQISAPEASAAGR